MRCTEIRFNRTAIEYDMQRPSFMCLNKLSAGEAAVY